MQPGKLLAVLCLMLLTASLVLPATAMRAQAGEPPCTTRPDNLTRNGSVGGGYNTQYGVVANDWNPFIFGGDPPAFDLVDNENANGDSAGEYAQYIHGDGVLFDAGIYQVVQGTRPGVYYRFSVGWGRTLRDTGGGKHVNTDQIERMVGIDPTGGADPHSGNVIWGPVVSAAGAGLNMSGLTLVVPARADHVTVFARTRNRTSSASDKQWFDVMCLLPREDMPTATPDAPTSTATPEPKSVAAAAAVPVKTPVPPTPKPPTATPVPPTDTPTPTLTSTPTFTPTPTDTGTPRPRRIIPTAGAESVSAEITVQGTTDAAGPPWIVGGLLALAFIGGGACFGGVGLWMFLRRH